MAEATGKLQWSTSLTPIEVLSDAETNTIEIASSTCYGTVGGNGVLAGGASVKLLINDTGNATSGYINGVKQYKTIASAAEAATGTILTALSVGGSGTDDEGVWIKNSGYQYDTLTATSTTANAVDTFLIVRAVTQYDGTALTDESGIVAGQEPIIAVLAAGEGIFFPLRKTMSNQSYSLASSTVALDTGNISASGETIAAEILVF